MSNNLEGRERKDTPMGKNLFVSPHGNNWAVQQTNAQRANRVVPTQHEAIAIAKEMAKQHGQEVCIQGRDGKIRQKNSYGPDDFPPRG